MLDRIEPGAGGELQLTDAIALLLEASRPCSARCCTRPLRRRPEARLPARQRRARARPRRSRPARSRRGCASSCSDAGSRDLARRRAAARSSTRSTPLAPRIVRRDDARGLVLARGRRRDGGRCRRSRTPAWTATRCARPTPQRPVRLRVVGELPAGRAPTTPVGPGEAIRIMTGAPMPDGADAIVMVERTRTEGDDVVVEVARARRSRAARGRRPRRRAPSCSRSARCSRPRTSACSRASTSTRCACHPRPRVGVISTGDELVERGSARARADPRLEPADAARPARRGRAATRSTAASRATTRPRSRRRIEPRGRRAATRCSRAARCRSATTTS